MKHLSRRGFLTMSMAALPAWGKESSTAVAYLKPDDPGYEEARRPFNSVIQLKPAWIARCRTEAEVAAAVRQAKELGLPVAVTSGGHAFHGFNLNEGGLLVELSDPCFSAVILNGSQAAVLLTSTRAADGPAFRSAASAFLKAGFTSKGALNRPLARALGSYEGWPGPLPFDNVSAGYYRSF